MASNGEIHCTPCSYITNQNSTAQKNACSAIYKFQIQNRGTKSSMLQSCARYSKCRSGLECVILYNSGAIGSYESIYTNNKDAIPTVCFTYIDDYCGLFTPCSSKQSCVRLGYNATPICLPQDAPDSVKPPFPQQFTVPRCFLSRWG